MAPLGGVIPRGVMMMKTATFGAAALFLVFSVAGQAADQQATALPGANKADSTCVSQHSAEPNLSATDLLSKDFDIKAAVPGGLWLQKKQEVFYCNAGVVKDGDTMCWKLHKPVSGQSCSEAIDRASAKDPRS
ncbi:hypothetical protein RSO01_69600 [Reyranella soli]|jgi:hypothetical protein|uniref:Uncharacterized protein n=2 Tax=Reyranella soli TaxID=1230389 RepID=A0A512NLG8_9HYPH|nr:hypothetical protein RSO01_69600 [Reyranella soli]